MFRIEFPRAQRAVMSFLRGVVSFRWWTDVRLIPRVRLEVATGPRPIWPLRSVFT